MDSQSGGPVLQVGKLFAKKCSYRACICKLFKGPRNGFPAWRAGTTGRQALRQNLFLYRARICKPFKEPRNGFPAWWAVTTGWQALYQKVFLQSLYF
jgi:hypothetical protein